MIAEEHDAGTLQPVSKFAKEWRLSPVTIRRWIVKGSQGIRLKAIALGSRIFIRQSDWDDFMKAVNDARLNPDPDARMNPDLEKSDKIDKEVKRTDRERRESVKAARAKINNTNKRKAG